MSRSYAESMHRADYMRKEQCTMSRSSMTQPIQWVTFSIATPTVRQTLPMLPAMSAKSLAIDWWCLAADCRGRLPSSRAIPTAAKAPAVRVACSSQVLNTNACRSSPLAYVSVLRLLYICAPVQDCCCARACHAVCTCSFAHGLCMWQPEQGHTSLWS